MIKNYPLIAGLFVALFTLCGNQVHAQDQQLAFPGAEGFGRFTTGGRGGEVIEVTNLNSSGAGSFRAAVEKSGARTIVFRVSGTIHLESDLRIRNGNLTIAGQTAPGEGITIKGSGLVIDADNIIIRYLRIRPGDVEARELDAMWGRENKNIIIDHCSLSWSTDEVGSFYDNENFTMQWCILSESLYESVHDKGRHGYGGIWGGMGATFHHNLLAYHSSRNPRFNGARYTTTPETELVDFRNNVIFNWGGNSAYGGEGGKHNMVANYYKAGPATNGQKRYRIINPSYDSSLPWSSWYVADNYVEGYPEVTADNWNGGVQGPDAAVLAAIKVNEPFPYAPVTTQTAQAALASVLADAGASYPYRDAVDARVANEVETGQVTHGGAYGAGKGIIDTQETVGGWPEMFNAPAPEDSDRDGMPDAWESVNGLDAENPADRNADRNGDGYTNLEEYLNGLLETAPTEFLRYPTEVTASNVTTNSISLSWSDNTESETNILLERSVDEGTTYTEIAELAPNTTSYTNEELEAGQWYYYRLRVKNEELISAYSNSLAVQTQPAPVAPFQPSPADGRVGVAPEQLTLSWSGDAPQYDLYMGSSADQLALIAEGLTETTYTVTQLQEATPYYWRVTAVGEGEATVHGATWTFTTGNGAVTGLDDPEALAALNAFPNPFSGSLTISFELKKQEPVLVSLYDMQNRLVKDLAGNTVYSAGTHQITLDETAGLNGKLLEGIYFCVLQTPSRKIVRRVIYIKEK
ncbi:T9SS type A sorting domain-containing protein [Cesiribacter sp. SM1]|uniref:T9SS type A sorting domain-containing protein n=1 Tax=Cesiribacter sp. SM1 TaxID=2861196 RepID=UPI001CD3176C|nr:T9SS type A sorting domain-containing protein [Cesiribacter sp. SM1]